jgi:hypothetical protein
MALGIQFGQIILDQKIRLDSYAVTRPGPDAVALGGGDWRATTADIVLQGSTSGYHWTTLAVNSLASVLLHELGHVFNSVVGLGGSKIKDDANADGTINSKAQQENRDLLKNCEKAMGK